MKSQENNAFVDSHIHTEKGSFTKVFQNSNFTIMFANQKNKFLRVVRSHRKICAKVDFARLGMPKQTILVVSNATMT